MRCSNCQIYVVAGALFCNHCGIRIQKLCNNCYSSNPAESRFCRSCGGSLSSAPEPPAPEPSAASAAFPGQGLAQDSITTCPRCSKVNEPGSAYCFSCGLPLVKDSPAQTNGRNSSITESPIHWYIKALKKYAVFNGRARRKEFWYFFLFQSIFFILFLVAGSVIADSVVEAGLKEEIVLLLLWLYLLVNFIPSLAVSIRRLHDVDRSGWYSLAPLIPWLNLLVRRLHDVDRSGWLVFMEFIAIIGVIASLVFLVWAARDSSPGENRFGPNPKDTIA